MSRFRPTLLSFPTKVEYGIFKVDPETKTVKLSLRGAEVRSSSYINTQTSLLRRLGAMDDANMSNGVKQHHINCRNLDLMTS